MSRRLFALLLSLAALAGPASLSGQSRPATPTISVLTFGPGPLVFERFGHIAIRIQVPGGADLCYDWGNFDFDEPGFLPRFVRGDMRYWMQGKYTRQMLPLYEDADRTVIEQRLNLSNDQRRRLIDTLSTLENTTGEGRFYYQYDYYADNCSTRVRDAIDAVIDGELHRQTTAMTGHGYRWHTRRLMSVGLDNQTLAPLMDFLAGPRVDRPLSEWELGFLPMELTRQLDRVTVFDESGRRVPLVAERRVRNQTTTPGNADPAEPGRPWIPATLAGVVGGATVVVLGRISRTSFIAAAAIWEAFASFGFAVIAGMSLFTRHWPTAWNANVLHFSPLAFAMLVVLLVGRSRRRLRWAAPASLACSALGAAIALSGLTPQQSWPAIGLALPLHAAVFFVVRRWPDAARTRPVINGVSP